MKKNLILYLLILFLIVVNGYFIYNQLTYPPDVIPRDSPQGFNNPLEFIADELQFSEKQSLEFEKINRSYQHAIEITTDKMNETKELLKSKLANKEVSAVEIDSLTQILGKKEQEREKLIFYYLRNIQKICDNKQKEQFINIINDAMHKGEQDDSQKEMRPNDHSKPPRP